MGLVHWDDAEGWYGEGGEIYISKCPLKSSKDTMEYYSAIKKNTFESVLMRWMKMELSIKSEVSQKVKHQYSILTHIFGI